MRSKRRLHCNSNAQESAQALTELVNIDDDGSDPNCPHGGTRILVGLDNGDGADGIAGDGVLQTGESIRHRRLQCAPGGKNKALR